MSALLEVEDVSCAYGGQTVVHAVSFAVEEGSLACLLGPSGCGKTTLLRAVAGLEPVAGGRIRIRGETVSGSGLHVAPERRRVGMVFQDNALFPHLSVAGNIGFGLRSLEAGRRTRAVHELLDLMGLRGLATRFPHELSGGQQQRVALARALAPRPSLVLLDEPFSSLDVELRERLGIEVREILEERGTTALVVTHDQQEAFALADEIGVINDGRLLQWDVAYRLYHEPADRFVADFIGQGVFLRGRLVGADRIETEMGSLRAHRRYDLAVDSEVDVLVRPDDIRPDPASPVRATVVRRAFKGAQILYTLRLPTGSSVLSLFPSHEDHPEGEEVGIRLQADHVVAFVVSA